MTRAKLPSPVPTEHSLIGECLLVYIWNAPDLIENIMEVFMNDFSVYGKDFEECLENLDKVLKRCLKKFIFIIEYLLLQGIGDASYFHHTSVTQKATCVVVLVRAESMDLVYMGVRHGLQLSMLA
jgi:hypothetical protein